MNNPIAPAATVPDSSEPSDTSETTSSSDPTDTTDAVTPTPDPSTPSSSDSTTAPAVPDQSDPDPTAHTTNATTPSDPTTHAEVEPSETEPSHLIDPESDEDHSHRRHHKNIISYTDILENAVAALVVFMGFALIRLIYVMSWKLRFCTKDNRKKAVAYYHYFSFMSKILGTKLPKKAVGVAQKAAFSNEEISDEEIKLLVSTSNESAKALSEKLPLYRRVPYRFFEITI